MDKVIMKYNPAFLKPEELVTSFAVRHGELDTIVRIIRENVTKSNQHVLVIGPRGIGKTMLVLRVAEEIKRDDQLNKKWYPLVFSEESYQVGTCGEFWLESLFHLAEQTKDERWHRTYEELKEEKNEHRLRESALAQLMDFADKLGKRIILVVENLNMLLGDQMNDEEAWALRHTLLNEPRVMLLASAVSRFEQVKIEGKPMFELFRFLELKPLTGAECRKLWALVTGKKPDDARVRPLEILTGGNPRLMAIVSNFAAEMSLKNLMNDLMQLVDEHTEYFKSHLDNLPAVERKVYIALAEIWDPATARQVGKSARLEVSKTSALLARLMERGAVVEANGKGKAKLYQVAERMYNIYYLMRKRGEASQRVRAVVNFMTGFYGADQLLNVAKNIAEEGCTLPLKERADHYMAYEGIVLRLENEKVLERILEITPRKFLEDSAVPVSLRKVVERIDKISLYRRMSNLAKRAQTTQNDAEELENDKKRLRDFVRNHPKDEDGWALLGGFLVMTGGPNEEAEKACRKALRINSKHEMALGILGILLTIGLKRYKEAVPLWKKLVEVNPKSQISWENLGWALVRIAEMEEAEKAFRKVLELGGKSYIAYKGLGEILAKRGQIGEAEKYLREAIKIEPKDIGAWGMLLCLWFLLKENSRQEASLKIWRDYVENVEPCDEGIDLTRDMFVMLAGRGYEHEALEILRGSAWAEALEPVVVALRLMAGEDVKAAAEIMEVGKDVVKRIEEVRNKMQETKREELKK